MRRRRGVAGGKTERAGGGGSDKELDTEGETAYLNGELRKEISCPRGFIMQTGGRGSFIRERS